MPRLGKIHLGIKVEPTDKSPYPKAVDYFVCPPEVQEVYGKEPKELDIMLPSENPEQFAQQWLRRYSRTQGLICIGDGINCRRKVDVQTGAMVTKDSREWVWKESICNSQECPDYTNKLCRRIINLQVFLFNCPGLGVYQIDSSSFYSIVNINSMVAMLKATLGRCSMLPLKLVLGPVEVTPPGESKKTVYVMHISSNIKLGELAKMALLPPAQALLPEPETVEPPEDFYPPGILAEDDDKRAAVQSQVQEDVVTPSASATTSRSETSTATVEDKKAKAAKAAPTDKKTPAKPKAKEEAKEPAQQQGSTKAPPAGTADPEATQEEKRNMILALRTQGKDNAQIQAFFLSVTGKKGRWLHSDIMKLELALKNPPPPKPSPEEEADAFLKEMEGK
jgi:hypothetical protein